MDRRQFLIVSVAAAAAVLPLPAFAQANQALFDYQLKNVAQTDTDAPMLILRAREFIKSGTVVMRRGDGKETTTKLGSLKPGQEKRVPFKQGKGSFSYEVRVSGTTNFDQTMDMTFTTDVHYVDPIKLDVDKDQVRLAEGQLVLKVNVPLDKVDIEVFDDSGNKLVETTQVIGGKYGSLPISWPPTDKEIAGIRLTAHDVAGFWAGVILEPFFVEIPHEDIVFDTGKSTWQPVEEPKLVATMKLIEEALRKHKDKGLNVSMYVAGYTDTVGGHADNIKLSTDRARAIGAWFRKKGLKIDVFYQGFGESALAVQTPDDTDEARNRRAMYILGNAPPPTSAQIPKANWKKL